MLSFILLLLEDFQWNLRGCICQFKSDRSEFQLFPIPNAMDSSNDHESLSGFIRLVPFPGYIQKFQFPVFM